jgi:hypothetical protein
MKQRPTCYTCPECGKCIIGCYDFPCAECVWETHDGFCELQAPYGEGVTVDDTDCECNQQRVIGRLLENNEQLRIERDEALAQLSVFLEREKARQANKTFNFHKLYSGSSPLMNLGQLKGVYTGRTGGKSAK